MDNLKTLKTLAIASLAILAVVAFALGFYPLEESARRGGLGIPVLLPVLIDLGLVLMGLGAMAARANQLKAWPMRVMAAILILVSACVQYFHASNQPDVTPIDIVVAVLPPIVLWAASSAVETLLFGNSVERAVVKAETEAARQASRLAARDTAQSSRVTKTSVVKPKNQKSAPAQETKLASPKLEPNTPKHSETTKPVSLSKPSVTPAVKLKTADISDTKLQEAIALVIGGEPLSTVAKQYGIARSTLGRKADAVRANT